MNEGNRVLWRPIWVGGILAGTVDVGAACLIYKVGPFIILQAIAGGVLGSATFSDGWHSALLGLVLQWSMSILIAACCVLARSRSALLAKHWIIAGYVYGVITFLVMNFIVVPLSASSTKPHYSMPWLVENLLAMLLFGLIISAAASHQRLSRTQ